MSVQVTQGIPSSLVIGDAASFKITNTVFPATGWTSKLNFKFASGVVKSFDGTASGADHLFTLSNADTASLSAGRGLVCLVFSDGTNRQSGDWQEINLLADPTKVGEKTFAQKQVELLQGVIAQFNSTTRRVVNFNGQNFERASIAEYQKQLTYYEARVVRERELADAERGIMRSSRISPEFVSDTFTGQLPTSTRA